MSLDTETRLRVLLASAPQDHHRVETLEISHSAMSKMFWIWKEPRAGEITTEDGLRTVLPVNFEWQLAGTEASLDQVYRLLLDTSGGVEDEFREQMDLIPLDTEEYVRCVYREYLSDDLGSIVAGPAVLQVETVAYQIGAANCTAVSPRLNSTRTGELYEPRSIPTLRAFL